MMKVFVQVALLLALGLVQAKPAPQESPSLHIAFERYVRIMKKINNSPMLRKEWAHHVKETREPLLGRRRLELLNLNCAGTHRSSTKPTSVHKLRVGDIDIVAAMGDSLTAGNGVLAWTILGCLTEYRGRSWSIGGDGNLASGITTLPNILRTFNENLRGFSTGSGDENSNGANLNVAAAGDVAQDIPGQAIELVQRLQSDPNINFQDDWKMVTLFIGGNNLCAYCNDLVRHSAATYRAEIMSALDYLHDNSPRTFVNLVEIFDISPVAGLGDGLICNLVHSAVCSCGHGASADRVALTELSIAYQRALQELVDSGRYDTKDDFTVVLQPFFRETTPPSEQSGGPDMSYFAPDCFHFSSKGQNGAGKALWNTMLQTVGAKQEEWGLNDAIACPREEFIPTRQN